MSLIMKKKNGMRMRQNKRLSIEDILNYGIMQGLAGIGMLLLFWEWERDKGTK